MKTNPFSTHRLFLMVAVLLAVFLNAHGAEHQLRPGVIVDFGDGAEPNRVWINFGHTVLAIDTERAATTVDAKPGFVVATGAETIPAPADSSTLLWPGSRPETGASASESTIVVESGFTLKSTGREIIFFDFGRAASAGDLAVWLPRERVLITGRLCTHAGMAVSESSDTDAWLEVLDRLLDLDPELVIPFTGKPGGIELLAQQRDRLQGLRTHISDALLAGRSAQDAAAGFSATWFENWREADSEGALQAFDTVFGEMAGLRPPWELIEERGLRPGASPTAEDEGWTKPRKVLWRNTWPDRLPLLAQVAPGVEIVPFKNNAEAMEQVADADAIIGTATAELLASGARLRWVQVGSAGVERYLRIPELAGGNAVLTNGQRLASKTIGEHVMALARALARGLNGAISAQNEGQWKRSEIGNSAPLTVLRGKTMLVVGLGGIGTEVARLADGAGMRVLAIRNSRRAGPPFVDRVGLGEDLPAYLAEADVVANCLPLTDETRGSFNSELFAAMKPSAFFINVGRGGTVNTADLIKALEDGSIAGAGLDVTDPEPLPDGHALWKAPNLIITPHFAAWSDAGRELHWLLYRENLRRFVAGEPLLSVVDPTRGY